MPVLSNPRHERFAQELAKGGSQIAAYENAGYKPDRGAASNLSAKPYISQRVAELQGMAAARTVKDISAIDKRYVLQQAVKLHEAAMKATDGEDGFDPKAGNVASRALDQIGRHVDVQAFKDVSDVNINITLDAAIGRLDAIEGEFTEIEPDGT
jgi:hypothetical protein